MSMTREEAKTILFNAINTLWEHDSVHYADDIPGIHLALRSKALSILAPSPRKEPPTVEAGNVWYSDAEDVWVLTAVDYVRKHWRDGEQWLPESALPKGVE